MRGQQHLLIKGAKVIAVLTVGSGVLTHQTQMGQVTNNELLDPVKDIAERAESVFSSSPITFAPIMKAPQRSQTMSSAKSTLTIRTFLVKRRLAHIFFNKPLEIWSDDAFFDEPSPHSVSETRWDTSKDGPEPGDDVKDELPTHFTGRNDRISEEKPSTVVWKGREREENNKKVDMDRFWQLPRELPLHQLPWQLHQQSLDLFAELSRFIATSLELGNLEDDLRDGLARLFLWGESFGDGRLDHILANSTELRVVILELCTTISKVLIDDIVPLLANLDLPAVERISHMIGLIQRAEQAEQEIFNGTVTECAEALDTGVIVFSEHHRSMAEAVQTLCSSVDCLMRLAPTMEKTSEFVL